MNLTYGTLASIAAPAAPEPLRNALHTAAYRLDEGRMGIAPDAYRVYTVGCFEGDAITLVPGVTPERCPHCADDPHCLHRAAALLASAQRCSIRVVK